MSAARVPAQLDAAHHAIHIRAATGAVSMTDQATLDAIDKAVKSNDVVLFMKGTPTFPQCGFSSTVVQILDYLGVEYVSTNVLENAAVREGIKQYTNWPTIPQLYVNGEFVNNVKKLVAVLGAASLLLVTGCSSTNSAATIGDTVVPISTLQGTVNEIVEERNKVETEGLSLAIGEELNVNAVRFHIISVLFDELAARINIKITGAEIGARRADIITQIGGEDRLAYSLVGAQIAPSDFERYIRTVLLAEKLGEALIANGDTSTDGSGIQNLIIGMAKELKVEINPRYGVWDYASGNIAPIADNATVKK